METTVTEQVVTTPIEERKLDRKSIIKNVDFDVVAKAIMKKYHILTIDDTKEVYVYQKGVYSSKGAVNFLEREIRQEYQNIFYKLNKDLISYINENDPNGFHIPVPKISYINEAMAYIKGYTTKFRDDIDTLYPHMINLLNGMFDVKQWKLFLHDPKFYSIRQIPLVYNPEARCPQIMKFLADVVSENDSKVLIEFAGYSLIPETSIQKAVMLYGEGANGKSVFLKFLTKFIGDNNVSGVSLQALENDKFKVADLYGKLLNIYPDLKDQAIYHSDIFKTLVGGDRMQGEKKYKDSFWFYNTARLMFSANKIPEVKNTEFAYFRRWILINFPNQFKEGQNDDKHLFEKLTTPEELSGFLNLALSGLKRVLETEMFSYDQSIESVEKLYKSRSSSVGTFAENCLIMSVGDTRKTVMYEKYVEWAQAKNLKPVAPNEFGKKFKNLGYDDSHPYDALIKDKVSMWNNVVVDSEKFNTEVGKFEEILTNDDW